MHVQSYLNTSVGVSAWVLSHLKLKYVCMLECGKINYHLCFKISSSRNPSHENVEVTLLTANKRGFQLEKGANRNKCIRSSHLQSNKNGCLILVSLPQKTRVPFQLGH